MARGLHRLHSLRPEIRLQSARSQNSHTSPLSTETREELETTNHLTGGVQIRLFDSAFTSPVTVTSSLSKSRRALPPCARPRRSERGLLPHTHPNPSTEDLPPALEQEGQMATTMALWSRP
jgi:hypothetical protein